MSARIWGVSTPDEASQHLAKHLEFVQAIISRLANSSFLIKGWTLTLATGSLAFLTQGDVSAKVGIGLIPTILFWLLDSYFLRQERLFRALYDEVRVGNVAAFSMDVVAYNGRPRMQLKSAVVSTTLLFFYGGLLILQFLISVLLVVIK